MRIQTFSASALLMLAGAAAQAATPLPPAATFNADAEGWVVVDFPSSSAQYISPGKDELEPNHFAGGGANGGYIGFPDPSSDSFFFSAPAGFVGDWSDYFGGRLRYTQKVTAPAGFGAWRGDPDVVLVSNGRALLFQHPDNPGSGWTSFSAALNGTGWHYDLPGGAPVSAADFRQALGNVSALYLRGEYIAGVVETTALDNVAITPVPEPETYAMLLAGLGLVGLAVRRHRR